MHFLIAESETAPARDQRRRSVGRSSGETFEDVLLALAPGARCTRVQPVDAGAALPDGDALAGYDAVFLTGSPLHLYKEMPETRRAVAFMRAVFASGTPTFGSCAGLQVATVAAGGTVRSMESRREAGFARRIYPTDAGRAHPLLAGRPPAFDAPAIHTDEVERLPAGATLLASNAATEVQAAEIAQDGGLFWGVQYHPEISLAEVAGALRRSVDDIVQHGLARDETDVEQVATAVETLGDDPRRSDILWRLGLDEAITRADERRAELRNFIERLVRPERSRRGRG